MKSVVLFAFNGELMCFMHILLNALEMEKKGYKVKVVIEGAATKLIPEISLEGNPANKLYLKAKEQNLIGGVSGRVQFR